MSRTERNLARLESTDLWDDLDPFFGEFARRFDELAEFPLTVPTRGTGSRFRAARADVRDSGNAYRISAEVPGIAKENLDIRINGPIVEIRAEGEKENETKEEKFVHRERVYAGFYRSFELPEPVRAEEAKARVKDGLLLLELPKQTPTPAPSEVRVKVE